MSVFFVPDDDVPPADITVQPLHSTGGVRRSG
jgi:hypothetical protein